MTFAITALSIKDSQHYNKTCYGECRNSIIVLVSVGKLSVIMLNVVMLNDVMLTVVAPFNLK
jgi:hypothetical protein